jgi:hypothetical protein
MTATTIRPDIDQFAANVRSALKDLGSEEVSELTEGLEADLVAQAAEQGDSFELPDVVEYASELREAAGLPAVSHGLFGLVERVARRVNEFVVHNRIVSPLARLFVSFAPVWWIVRGYLAFYVVQLVFIQPAAIFPTSPVGWLVLASALYISTQLGRRAWKLNRFWSGIVTVLNVFAVIVAPGIIGVVASVVSEGHQLYNAGAVVPQVETGLRLNSQQVDNIFVYDEKGNPLTDVQLFTQDGDPISVKFNTEPFPSVSLVLSDSYTDFVYTENTRALRGSGWNVFPLPMIPTSDVWKVEAGEDVTWDAVPAPLPYPTVPALKETQSR